MNTSDQVPVITVSLLTGGGDRPYAFGLATALIAKGAAWTSLAAMTSIARNSTIQPGVNFLNLRGDQRRMPVS